MYLRLLFVPTFEAASINTKVLPVDCWSTVQRSGWKDEQSCCCWSIQPVNSHVKPSFGYPRIIHLLDHPKNHENLAMMPWFNAQSHGVMAFPEVKRIWRASVAGYFGGEQIALGGTSFGEPEGKPEQEAAAGITRQETSLSRHIRHMYICIYIYIMIIIVYNYIYIYTRACI